MLVGLGFTLLGWIGVFLARVIKAAVSRQREFLADASAVQFTRQTEGIANALKKIGGYSQHSYIRAADPEEVSHMLFAGGLPMMTSLLATHPPLTERIQALDPSFRAVDYPQIGDEGGAPAGRNEQVAGFTAPVPNIPRSTEVRVDSTLANTVGRPAPEHVGFAQALRGSIPAPLYKAAHSPSGAYLLTLALVVDAQNAERQLSIIEGQMGDTRALQVKEYVDALAQISPIYRLPLLEISFPELKKHPAPKLDYLLKLVRRLIEDDGRIDIREFCAYQIIARHLAQAAAPGKGPARNRVSKTAARDAAIDLLRVVADQGHTDDESRQRAFKAGLGVFGDWAKAGTADRKPEKSIARLEEALDILSKINSAGRQSLIDAVTKTIVNDGHLTVPEAELLRAICATLDCPLPPIISVV